MIKKLPCLLCTVTNNHGTEIVILVGFSKFGEIIEDVVEHRTNEMRMSVDFFPIKTTSFNLKLCQCSLQFSFVLAADSFAYQAKGVAVSNRGVVIVFVYVVTEEFASVDIACSYTDKWCACQSNFNGIYVGLIQIG